LNSTVPNTALTPAEAKRRLGLEPDEKVLLFYGNIAPYKGLEYLVDAFAQLPKLEGRQPEARHEAQCSVFRPPPSALCHQSSGYRLVIAGRVKQFITVGKKANCDQYWTDIEAAISRNGLDKQILRRIEFIPDAETELYFKAADVLILPYTHIFQSGVLFLGYNFGLPVIAADVGSLKEEIVEGKTGFVFPPRDPEALAGAIEAYFTSDLYANLEHHRPDIRRYASERYSWSRVADTTTAVYDEIRKGRE
jgi:glycosyltransferase involved in cell wall biosynthesis